MAIHGDHPSRLLYRGSTVVPRTRSSKPAPQSTRLPVMPHWESGKGSCRWCGTPVLKNGVPNLRALWHPKCVTAYKVATRSVQQRLACWRRDKGKCAKCGTVHLYKGDWDADHVVPLHLAIKTNPQDPKYLKYWGVSNLQTLCTSPCHREKSAAEMSAYHASKRIHMN